MIPDTNPAPRPVILNVEDFDPARFIRTRLLRSAGYDVVEAGTGREALAAATRKAISLALVDVHLPDANGIDLCDTLKRLQPEVPVLLISAVALSTHDRRAGWEAGAYAYLGEPLPSDALVRSVREALDGRTATEADADAWVVTDPEGLVLSASVAAARLLSCTMRGLNRRSLVVFFERDRDTWRADMTRAARGERIWRSGRLRPKERRPFDVFVTVERAPSPPASALLWTFQASDESSPETTSGDGES